MALRSPWWFVTEWFTITFKESTAFLSSGILVLPYDVSVTYSQTIDLQQSFYRLIPETLNQIILWGKGPESPWTPLNGRRSRYSLFSIPQYLQSDIIIQRAISRSENKSSLIITFFYKPRKSHDLFDLHSYKLCWRSTPTDCTKMRPIILNNTYLNKNSQNQWCFSVILASQLV